MSNDQFWLEPKEVTLRDGRSISLRPEIESDLEPTWDMFSSLSNKSLEFLPIPFTRDRIEGWFKNIDYTKTLPILGIVEDGDDIRVVASASLMFHEMELYKHRASVGITVHDDYQNQGLGTILTEYLIEISRAMGLRKVDLMVVAHNDRAIRVYEKLGFVKEGHFKMNHFNQVLNEFCDEYKMGLVLED